MHHYRHVLVRMRQGESDRQIAAIRLMGRRAAGQLRKRAQALGWLDPARALPADEELARILQAPKMQRAHEQSSLHPYRELIAQWLSEGINGTTIYAALQRNHHYTGSYSSVSRYLRTLSAKTPRVTSVLEFAPAQAAQVDFGQGPEMVDVHTGEVFKTWVFVMVLAWSRHQYAELVRDQSVETWLGCHRRSFEHFNGVPSKIIIDNPKCAITKACYYDPLVQRAYADYAEGYGFLISPCPVADPQKKGRVEAGVKFVKNNFMPLREFRSLEHANEQLMDWVMSDAGNRIHGTTRTPPLKRFIDTEQALLTALPNDPPQCARWATAKLHGDCHVQADNCRYSAPWRLVSQTLDVRISESTVRLYYQHELKAIHPRLTLPGQRHTLDEHLPPEHVAFKMRDPQWCLKQAEVIGPFCLTFIQRLFAHRVLDRLRAAQAVVGLAKRYGAARLEVACQRALHFDNITYRTVRVILEKSLDLQANPEQCFDALSATYTGGARFARDTRDLFDNTH
jgi:transposase